MLSKTERETIITSNEAENIATVFTYNRTMLRKLNALAADRPDACRLIHSFPENGAEYKVPRNWCKIVPPRTLTDKQRQTLQSNLRSKSPNR